MDILVSASNIVARAAGGNPAISTLTIFIFYLAFNKLEAMIETLIFGERFEHWLDPIFILAFIGFAAMTVWSCSQIE